LIAAIGLNKHPADHEREASAQSATLIDAGAMLQWFTQKSNGDFGTAVILDKQAPAFAEDESNQLLLAKVRANASLRYMIGAAWSEASGIRTMRDWRALVTAAAARERSPVRVTWSPQSFPFRATH